MFKFQAHATIAAINNIANIEGMLGFHSFILDDGTKKFLATNVDHLIEQAKQLDLRVSLKKAEALRFALTQASDSSIGYGGVLRRFIGELRERFQHELESKAIYAVSKHQQYLEALEPPFGEDVQGSFPSARYDIEEAGKCLALNRYTACVTHLMRALEVGLAAMATALDIQFSHSNWGNLIDQVEKEVKRISKATHGDNWKDHQKFFSEAAFHFRVLKDAWRNHAMHARERYNEDEAEIMYMSACAFMRQLAMSVSEAV